MVSDRNQTGTELSSGPAKIAPIVALTLLEVIRSQDLPAEILRDEDPAVTMPRRLGLSDVILQQIERHRSNVKRGHKVSDSEIRDLFNLVTRRPDSQEVFFELGVRLSGQGESGANWRRFLLRRLAYRLARGKVLARMKALFGRRVGGFAPGLFIFEARAHLFIQGDPGGDACHMVSGIAERILARYTKSPELVVHVACQSRGDPVCRWTSVPTVDDALGKTDATAESAGDRIP